MSFLIQNLIFPRKDICLTEAMYLRGTPYYSEDAETISLQPGQVLSFSTYFNMLPIAYWKQYTILKALQFRLTFSGELTVRLIGVSEHNTQLIQQKKMSSSKLSSCEVFLIPDIREIPFDNISIELVGESVDLVIGEVNSGWYTEDSSQREVSLALIMPTFKREQYVIRNLGLLQRYIPSKTSLHIFVIDNAQTLPMTQGERVEVIKNINYGGSGGFARGLYEVESRGGFTHVLYSDDDVDMEPRVYLRVLSFFQFCNNPQMTLGGAMLYQHWPAVQHERFGFLDRGFHVHPPAALDLIDPESVVQNNEDIEHQYCSWWFYVFPLQLELKNKYPLPLFFKYDDVDFSLRLTKHDSFSLNFNGLAVWHEAFDKKRSSVAQYYEARNRAILQMIHHSEVSRWRWLALSLKTVYGNLLFMRYDMAEKSLEGAFDALKGAEFLSTLEADVFHARLMQSCREAVKPLPENIHWNVLAREMGVFHKIAAVLTLFGNIRLFRARSQEEVLVLPIFGGRSGATQACFADSITFVDQTGTYGMTVRRDRKQFFLSLFRSFRLILVTLLCFGRARDSYRDNYERLTSRDFWGSYLKIDRPAEPKT